MFHRLSLFSIVFLAAIGAMCSSRPARALDAQISVGDKLVTTSEAALMAGKTTLLTVEAGTELVAHEIKGTWIRVVVQKDDKLTGGWIGVKHLARVGAAAEPAPKTKLLTTEASFGKVSANMVRNTLVVSSDGKRVAYIVHRGNHWAVVADGKIGEPYQDILRGSLTFSPDSKRVAYTARRGGKWLSVVDGVEGRSHDVMGASGLVFSPDGKRMAYTARRGDKWLVVVDAVEGKPYDTIVKGSLLFSPDSKQVAYIAIRGGKTLAVAGDAEGKPYDAINRAELTFDGPKSLHYVAVRGRELFRVEMAIDQE